MNASLGVGLAYFSFVALQKWLNWICGALMAVGLVLELRADNSHDLGGGVILATLAIMLIVIAPVFAGGLVMRIASSSITLHLRPQGRLHMLVGATLAITLATALFTLPMLVAELTGIRLTGKSNAFIPPLSAFQGFWGAAALNWIVVFAMSRYQSLAAFSFILIVGVVNVAVRLGARLPISPDQIATMVFVTGVVAWAVFAFWYLRTPSVHRPGWISGWAMNQPPRELERITGWRGLGGTSKRGESRSIALHHHLMGTDSTWSQLLIGALVAAVLLLVPRIFQLKGVDFQQPPMLVLMSVITGTIAGLTVRRSRMLWLRAGLNRAELFATAERRIWQTTFALFVVPAVLVIALPVALRTHQLLDVLLFILLQLTFAGCFMYAGLAMTRGWNAAAIAVVAILLTVLSIITGILAPHQKVSVLAYPAAIAVFGGLALIIRVFARRAWLVLDWRLTGPPLARQGTRGI